MARLPEADRAIIDEGKITHYLLSSGHPAGQAKAVFLHRFGFRISEWRRLHDALVEHTRIGRVATVSDSPFGKKYILEGPLRAPDGRMPRVRAIWFVPTGDVIPRLVTIYRLPNVER